MAARVNPELRKEIAKLGAEDLTVCMNCGNCTAVCSLSGDDATFPRRIIRYLQLGLEDRVAASPELWLCYYCGECSRTCPRQAEPGEIMAAARRYMIAQHDPTRLSAAMYKSKAVHWLVFAVLSAFFALWLLWHKGDLNGNRLGLFDWIPGHVVHDLGVAVFVVVGLILLVGLVNFVRRVLKLQRETGGEFQLAWSEFPKALGYALSESLNQARYRKCHSLDDPQHPAEPPLNPPPWLVHSLILWGFLGLFVATTLDYLFKPIGTPVPLWYPARLIGTVAGLACLYGTSVAIWRRWTRPTKYYANTHYTDWFLLWLLFATVVTGFVTEIVVYLPQPTWFGYITFLVHVVLAMDLIVLLPVTKFAHVVYRPVALLLHRWVALSRQAATEAATATN